MTAAAPLPHRADLHLDATGNLARWRPLVQPILAIPHLLVANVLSNLAGVLTLISWFAIVFTGRLPAGIAAMQVSILRYEARAYSYVLSLRAAYPAFELELTGADSGTDPLRVDIAPQLEGRNRWTVGLRIIWVLPALMFAMAVTLAATIASIVAFVAVLITGHWPPRLRRFVTAAGQLLLRVSSYSRLLVDDYPPFRL